MNQLEWSEPKKIIFETAIELFSRYSFESVSLNDIGKYIGKRKSGIYNHFSSKQEILDEIYDYFCDHFYDGRLSVKEMDPIIRVKGLMEIIDTINFIFTDEIKEKMLKILRIIHQRKYHDDRARDIAKTIIIDESIAYGEAVFDYAIEIGRLAPFDTHTLALLLNNCRQTTYARLILEPTDEYYELLVEEEKRIYRCASKLITELNITDK